MSDYEFEAFYRKVFADLTIDQQERRDIEAKLEEANPPPDKLVWLRTAAFRIGTEFISPNSDEHETNVALLRSINAVVHAIQMTRMIPVAAKHEHEDDHHRAFDEDQVKDLFRKFFTNLSVDDSEQTRKLETFFNATNRLSKSEFVWTRATAFKIATEFLSEDKNNNLSLFRCIDAIVHVLETTFLRPKPYVLKKEPPAAMSVKSVGLDLSLSDAVQHLWDLDVNRLTPGRDYVINVQSGKKPYYKKDGAGDPLFTNVDTTVFRRPTYKTFINLLDNYSSRIGVSEHVTFDETKENFAFLRAIMQTAPMQFCHKYCRCNTTDIPDTEDGFVNLLNKIWFEQYHRHHCGDKPDSSGFEHVFVGEIQRDEIIGFHNWIQFYLEEKKGNVKYRGYIKPKNYGDHVVSNGDDHVLTIQFHWHGIEKYVGSTFIGVSPEFEMALYTTCFLMGKEQTKVKLETRTDVFKLMVKCYTIAHDKIGASFIETLAHEE